MSQSYASYVLRNISPIYVAGHFFHDIWYTGPTTLSFFNLSLGLTSSCLSVLVVQGGKRGNIPYYDGYFVCESVI